MGTPVYTNLFEERRRRRSDNPLIATRLQLAQVMQDFALGACVIATEDGRLFAAPDGVDADEAEYMAAVAPEIDRGASSDGDLVTREFWAWDQPLILVARGPADEISLYRAILGIRRITRQALYSASA